jgi:hypothetical protein
VFDRLAANDDGWSITPQNSRSYLLGLIRSANDRIASGFTDDPLRSGITVVRAVHITELRSRIDGLRSRYGLGAFTYSRPALSPAAMAVSAKDVAELRAALSEAYTASGGVPPLYTDPVLVPGSTMVKAVHITELRAAILLLE